MVSVRLNPRVSADRVSLNAETEHNRDSNHRIESLVCYNNRENANHLIQTEVNFVLLKFSAMQVRLCLAENREMKTCCALSTLRVIKLSVYSAVCVHVCNTVLCVCMYVCMYVPVILMESTLAEAKSLSAV